MIQPEELVGGEWADWYRLTPVQRWLESEKLWQTYLALGGSLDPEPDTQSPFFDPHAATARGSCSRSHPPLPTFGLEAATACPCRPREDERLGAGVNGRGNRGTRARP